MKGKRQKNKIKDRKCVQEIGTGKIIRTDGKSAQAKVQSGVWQYVPKKEWKRYQKNLLLKRQKVVIVKTKGLRAVNNPDYT